MPTAFHPALRTTLISESPKKKLKKRKKKSGYFSAALLAVGSEGPVGALPGEGSTGVTPRPGPCPRPAGGVWVVLPRGDFV